MPTLEGTSPALLAALFAMAAAVVWRAGTQISRYAALIAERTGISGAAIGVLLLGFATSLPEVATSVTASAGGNAQLAVNNLLGGVAFQVLVLAIADAAIGRDALTALVPSAKILLQAVISMLLLAIALIGVSIGEPSVGPVGAAAIGIAAAYLLGLRTLRSEREAGWRPSRIPETGEVPAESKDIGDARLALATVAAALAILAAGVVLTLAAEALAGAAGVDTGLVALTLLAAATSLPEVSTAVAAVKLRQTEMAIGDVLGGNMFDTALILLVDLVYVGAPVLREVDRTAATAALLGILMTGVMLIGMIERRDRTILRMGYDSFAVIFCYVAGIVLIATHG